ncbi:Receptor-like kinase [Quillaja saponaria]|uniref:non-specific serine/threonine protein kinase n=1 Tax=Quillaja saponaria TaxID=32244 RepID=A0AAD7P6N5_QUISA|nr:Receptor-like kinase [Quillaja saponaria]
MSVEESEGETKESSDIESPPNGKFCYDEPSPRGVLEIAVLGTDSDNSGSSSYSSSPPEKSSFAQRLLARDNNGTHWKSVVDVFRKKSVRRFSTIPFLAMSYEISRKNLRRKVARIRNGEGSIDFGDLPITKPSWRNFDYQELAAATNNFSSENLIGKGGHAEVYKGSLSDGQVVAVKRLMKEDKEDEDRIADFLSELGIIAHINHPRAARLIGFGIDGGLHLVLQFLPHGSLATLLFGAECLEWKIRFKVAVGVAEGLQYLHQDCHRRIIHRDIKASNILLTEDYEAEISDFGLAKWLPENWPHHVVFPIEGTFGYLSPEYFMHGIVDEKTDVFAFGVILLELITGRRAVDSSRQSLVIWAKPLLDTNNVKELADPRLGNAYDRGEMRRTMITASMCIHHTPSKRPQMNRVVKLLKGEDGPIEMKQKSMAPRSLMLEACDLEDYTCSNYLNDLDRHRQLVME